VPDTHPVALSLVLLNRSRGENKTKKLMGWDKDRKIA